MAKVLKLRFKNGEDSNTTLIIRKPKEGLTEEVVKAAMQEIADSHAIVKIGVEKFKTPVSAEYVTTNSESVVAEIKA